MADIRASSLQEAIRFASRWNLLGIVSSVEPLVICPRLIKFVYILFNFGDFPLIPKSSLITDIFVYRVVKESGLVCVTYGIMNNDPKNVRVQMDQGVDAVIVDSVLAIRKGLTAAGTGTGYTTPGVAIPQVEKAKEVIEEALIAPASTSPIS